MARFDIEVHAEFPSRVVISMCEVVGGVVIDHDLVATLQIEKKDFFWHICLWLAKFPAIWKNAQLWYTVISYSMWDSKYICEYRGVY